jgi:hypothetical protein
LSAIIEGCWVLPRFACHDEYAGYRLRRRPEALFLYEPDIDALGARLSARSGDAQVPMQYQFGSEIKREAEEIWALSKRHRV